MACDLCGATGTDLVPLLDAYTTEAISRICPKCERLTNKQLSKTRKFAERWTAGSLKRWMANRRAWLRGESDVERLRARVAELEAALAASASTV